MSNNFLLKVFFFLIPGSIPFFVCSQNEHFLKFQIRDTIGEKRARLVLRQFSGEDFSVVDSVDISGASPFVNFKIKHPGVGLFDISVSNNSNKAEFIYNPSEKEINISAVINQLRNGSVEINNSPENKAYSELLNIIYQFDTLLTTQFYRLNGLSPFLPDYKKRLSAAEEHIEFIFREENKELKKVKYKYPGTYTARILIPLSFIPERTTGIEFDSYRSFLHKHYFDSIDFNNSEMLNHYAFSDKIFKYLTEYTDKTSDGTLEGIDVIMNSRKTNNEVNDFLFNYLLKSFIELKSNIFAQYLMEKHSNGCSMKLSVEDMKLLSQMNALSIGGDIPEISLPDKNNKYNSLKSYVSEKKFTILYFWISWCAKCQKQTPDVVELLHEYKKKGLGVYAVSLDEKKEDWNPAIEKNNSDFINVCEMVPIKNSSVAPSFNISTTPKIYIIDKDGKVVAKDIYGEELKKKIKALLNE